MELWCHPSITCSYFIWSYSPYNTASIRHSANTRFLLPFLDVLNFSIPKMEIAIPTSVGHCDSARRKPILVAPSPPSPSVGTRIEATVQKQVLFQAIWLSCLSRPLCLLGPQYSYLSSGAVHVCLFAWLRDSDGRKSTQTDQKHPPEVPVQECKCLQRLEASVHAVV